MLPVHPTNSSTLKPPRRLHAWTTGEPRELHYRFRPTINSQRQGTKRMDGPAARYHTFPRLALRLSGSDACGRRVFR